MRTWFIVGGRNGQKWIANAQAWNRRDALREAFHMVKCGYDWIDVFYHDEGDFSEFDED